MKWLKHIFTLVIVGSFNFLIGQTALITGVIFDAENKPIANVNISSGTFGTTSNADGFYNLQVTSDKEIVITFSHIGFKNIILKKLVLNTNETFEFYPVLNTNVEQIDEIVITAAGSKKLTHITTITPTIARKIPGANAGVENILKLLPSVSSNNELSTQYAVRGGNYDENLVYVNDIEVYRPFLIRSGQQEGFSFIHTDLIQKLEFSAGGFQAKYGDKLSSVLDISYKNPITFNSNITLSLLGVKTSLETISKNKKFTTVTGLRHRDNSLLVNSTQTKSNFKPNFSDFQTYTTYKFSDKFHLNFLGSFSRNSYKNKPLTRQTNFGTINDPKALVVYYNGQEKNNYNTMLAALKASYFITENINLKFISSLYHTTEEEYSDIFAQYQISSVEEDLSSVNFGNPTAPKVFGSQFKRTRNDLDALLFNLKHIGKYTKEKNVIEWGVEFKHEDIRDQLRESEFIDSAGYFIRPPLTDFQNNQPYTPYNSPIVAYNSLFAKNEVTINRFSTYIQYSKQSTLQKSHLYYNIGVRTQQWTVTTTNSHNSQFIVSPRAQIAIKPFWKKDMLFRFSAGVYQQAPFYRELRDATGSINTNVKAQKSIHYVFGNEFSFLLWERPFSLNSEAYYKDLSNINSYTLEDVRIRYAANNVTTAYVYGFETRLNGAFVPGTESWVSLGVLKTEENIDNKGFIARPTDQRVKLGILFQDYVPDIPNLKMYLNLVYNSGLPGGSPNYSDPYIYQSRLRDYKRADLGISYIFADRNNSFPKEHWMHDFKEFTIGVEIFNLFNNQNAITNTWVRDATSKQQYAIPNFMTSRVFNIKIGMQF